MSDDLDYLRELLSPLGTIRVRRMFGGWGLYCNEVFFALLDDERLYVKVDALSEPDFRAAEVKLSKQRSLHKADFQQQP